MSTLNQLANAVSSTLNDPFNHELNERIKDRYRQLGAKYLRQSIEKSGITEDVKISYVTTLTKVDRADSCAVDTDCDVLRTTNKIARPLRYKTDVPFTFVGDLHGKSFVYRKEYELRYSKELPFIGTTISYTYRNGYIYVYNNTKLKYIRLESVFTNPEDAVDICSGGNSECYSDDEEYMLPEDIIASVTQEIYREFGILPIISKDVKIDENEERTA